MHVNCHKFLIPTFSGAANFKVNAIFNLRKGNLIFNYFTFYLYLQKSSQMY